MLYLLYICTLYRVLKTYRQSSNSTSGYIELATQIIQTDGLSGLFGRGLQVFLFLFFFVQVQYYISVLLNQSNLSYYYFYNNNFYKKINLNYFIFF